MRRFALWFAPVWTAAVAIILLFGPVYGTDSSVRVIAPDGVPVAARTEGWAGLLAVNGPRALGVLVPVFLAALPLLARRPERRQVVAVVAALLVFGLAFLGAASVGPFFLPTAIALVFGAISADPASRAAS